jgi:hypothetical protein
MLTNRQHTCSQARGTCHSQAFLLDDKAATYENAAADSKGQAYVLLSHGQHHLSLCMLKVG